MDAVDKGPLMVEQLDGPDAVATVPEAIVTLLPVRSLVVHQEHVRLLTGDVRNHLPGYARLLDMPDDQCVGFPAVELRFHTGPYLREVELEGLPFIPEGRQQTARKS